MNVPEEADVVVIGAGIMGLAIAYNLARLGAENVLVLDRSYLCGGASGRNGGGIRAQWSSETKRSPDARESGCAATLRAP